MPTAGEGEGRTCTRKGRRADALWLVAALVLIGACLVPTLSFEILAWDDALHVTKNPAVVQPHEASLREHLLTPSLGYPIPVTVLTYTLEHVLVGTSALSLHVVNVLVALAMFAIGFGFARRLGLSRPAATLAILLFALHPAMAEPVSWISGRKDLLAIAFGIGSVWLALSPSRGALIGSAGLYALALLSKPAAAPLAALAVLAPLWFDEEATQVSSPCSLRTARSAIARAVPFLLVLLPISILGAVGQREIGALSEAPGEASRLQSAWYALGHHLSVLFLWEETTVKYVPLAWPPPFTPRVDLAPLLLVAVLLGGWFATRARARRIAVFGAVWGGLTYLPTSGLFFSLSRFLSDTYLAMPLFGVGLSAGALLDAGSAVVRAHVRRAIPLVPWLCALALAPLFLSSSARFHDDEKLWAHALERFPHHPRVCRQWANGVATVRGPAEGLAATDACMARFGPELFERNRAILLARLRSQASGPLAPASASEASERRDPSSEEHER